MYLSISENFNRQYSVLNNIRQTQSLILDQLYDLNNTIGTNRSNLITRRQQFHTPLPTQTFQPRTTYPTTQPPPQSRTTDSQPPQQSLNDRAANIEISFIDPRNPEQGILNNIFNNLLNPTSESNLLTFNDIITNTEIDLNTSNTNEMCSICRLNIEENNIVRKIKKCNHSFHQSCLDNWLKNHATCPNCRQDIRINEIQPTQD